jgi:RNA polymerase sigma-70 factor (ECF subfamily)
VVYLNCKETYGREFLEEKERERINVLIKRIALGDENALTELYNAVGGRMLSVALSIAGDRASAEDVLQDAFLSIVKNARKFRYYQNGYGWACTIVRNTALNYIKARNRRRCDNIDDLCFLASDTSVEDEATAGVTVREAIARLDKKQRAAIYYKYYEDLTVRQIAAKIGVSKSQADRIVKEAEAALRRIIDSGG